MGNMGLASLSFLSLLAASVTITFVQSKAVDLINTHGNDIGVYAYRGDRYMVLTWIAVIVMFVAVVAETVSLWGDRLERWNVQRLWTAGQLDFKTRQVTL